MGCGCGGCDYGVRLWVVVLVAAVVAAVVAVMGCGSAAGMVCGYGLWLRLGCKL